MSYARALENAWDAFRQAQGLSRAKPRDGLSHLTEDKILSVRLLADTYDIDLKKRAILSNSCTVPAKEYVGIILLHYVARKSKSGSLPEPSGEWIGFNQLEGGEAYYPTFKKRTIDVIAKKYGSNPDALVKASERFRATPAKSGDVGIVIEALDNVPILIALWRGDDEFGPEANINFDRHISDIFCTEDVVVLTEFLAHSL